MDRKVVAQFFSGDYDPEAEDRSRSSLASIEVAEQNKFKTQNKYVDRYRQDRDRLASQPTSI